VVAREPDGSISGFAVIAERGEVPVELAASDRVVARWRAHLRADPLPRGAQTTMVRFVACRDDRSRPSHAQAGLLLEIKRTYVARRPHLRRTYTCGSILAGADGHCAITLGYVPVPGEPAEPAAEILVFNDLGPDSVDGWLADLAARELDVEDQQVIDAVRRQLVLDGRRVDLTQLEFDVLRYLHERAGEDVPREALLRDVWGYAWTGGSNVVEVAISALRRKLGDRARALHTVRGVGYRLDALA